jgi:hypothetical protein
LQAGIPCRNFRCCIIRADIPRKEAYANGEYEREDLFSRHSCPGKYLKGWHKRLLDGKSAIIKIKELSLDIVPADHEHPLIHKEIVSLKKRNRGKLPLG